MLRHLFIIMLALGFVFVLYSMTAQNANACTYVCYQSCADDATCACTYGGQAQNHTRISECEAAPTGGPGGGTYPIVPECRGNETGVVIPPNCVWDCQCV